MIKQKTQSARPARRRWAAAASGAALAVTLLGAGTPAHAAANPAVPAAAKVKPITVNTANWSGSAGFGSRAPGWYTDSSAQSPLVVHLQGAARQTSTAGANADILGTLPAAARPSRDVYELVHTLDGTYADVGINTAGQILIIAPRAPMVTDFGFVSLEGISYERSISSLNFAVPLNTANWSGSAGFGSVAPSAWLDAAGYVHLAGAVTQTSSSGANPNLIGTLPGAYRPNNNVFAIVHTLNGTYVDLWISATTGQITVIGTRGPAVEDLSFLSLEGVTFSSGSPQVTPIPLNTANWSGNAGFGTGQPYVSRDFWGVVHLTGAVTQTSASGSGADLIGSLPAGFWPHHYVYEIVHTNGGTYADVSISTSGQISVITPRPPAVTDLSFLSLEGLSYQQ